MKHFPEKVTTGGLTGQGFINLLGRPRLELLPLVLREAVQNTWDARCRRGRARLRFGVRVRTLKADEEALFRKVFDQKKSLEQPTANALAKQMTAKSSVRVLEIADFGTVGLSGATRPDLPSDGENSRFVNFFFDIGRSHEESGDGGTYGFGRSSLYTAGSAALVMVDSLVEVGRECERRVMACRIAHSFEVKTGRMRGRYSGRHFWGRERDGVAQPLTGKPADAVADGLGLPSRTGRAHTGTTILIPWPVESFNDGAEIARTLLHHLWPKMVPRSDEPTISFDVEVDGRRFGVPDPSTVPEYRLFVKALRGARTATDGPMVRAIETQRPKVVTGHLGVAEGNVTTSAVSSDHGQTDDEQEDGSLSVFNHVALMRPSELVVRYLPVSGTEQSGKPWAGVFVCSSAEAVRLAFARAEPPAHDDWIADRLDDKRQRYLVRKTVKSLLPDAVRSALGVSPLGVAEEPANSRSLAATSERFSSMFLSGDGDGPGMAPGHPETSRRLGRGTSTTDRRIKIGSPVPMRLGIRNGVRYVTFMISCQGPIGSAVTVLAKPSVHGDGGLGELPEGLDAPTVIGWRGGDGHADRCQVTMERDRKELEVDVAFHDEYGVTLECVIEDQGA